MLNFSKRLIIYLANSGVVMSIECIEYEYIESFEDEE